MNLGSRKVLWWLLGVGFLLHMVIIFSDLHRALSSFLYDDAFYYYALVENVLDGNGIVFNLGIATNGFHPLYAILLIPIFFFLSPLSVDIPVAGSLVLLSIANVGTAYFLYKTVKHLKDGSSAFFSAFIWLFNPFVIFSTFYGLETAVQIFFLSWLCYYVVITKDIPRYSPRQSLTLGLLLGVVFLARLDGIFVALAFALFLLFRRFRRERSFSSLFSKDILIIGGVALLCALPWLLWSVLGVGELMPVSGSALQVQKELSGISASRYMLGAALSLMSNVTFFFFSLPVTGGLAGVVEHPAQLLVFLSGFLLLLLITIIPLFLMRKQQSGLSSLSFLWLAVCFYVMFYVVMEMGVRQWYSLFTSFCLALLSGLVVTRLFSTKKRMIALLVVLLVSFSLGTVSSLHYKPQALDIYKDSAEYMDAQLPLDVKIGSFNTGAYQYYSRNHDIINLDGVMNTDAYRAHKYSTIEDYVKEQNIRYVIDTENVLSKFSTIKFTEVASFSDSFDQLVGPKYTITHHLYRLDY